jgi:DNA-3-methyladenine glycosylase II
VSTKIHGQLIESAGPFPKVRRLFEFNGIITIKKGRDEEFFDRLAKTVISQQLSTRAASTIWNRIVEFADEKRSSVENVFIPKHEDAIRSCGISAAKFKAVCSMREAVRAGSVDLATLKRGDYESMHQTITKVWGYGPWSAEMMGIFFFGFTDVWAPKDLALKKGIEFLSDGNEKKAAKILEALSPNRSYFALHIWRGIDSKYIVTK